MKKDLKYIILLIATIALVVTVEMNKPKEIDWSESYSRSQKIPYGSYVLYNLLDDLFKGQEIKASYRTFYELIKGSNAQQDFNYIFIGGSFAPSSTDSETFADFIAEGNYAFIATENISEEISNLFNIKFDSHFPTKDEVDDLKILKLNDEVYYYEKGVGFRFITSDDSLQNLAKFSIGKPVLVKASYGEGAVFFCSVPLAFTNYNILKADNNKFVSESLTQLPEKSVIWDEYYTSGRQEEQSELRFILSREPLKWAYFMTISGILVFMIFEAKRKQRPIEVITPPKNNSLEFAEIVGRLFYSRQNHRNLALKKIMYFMDQVRTRYHIKGSALNDEFIEKLSDKSGINIDEIKQLADEFNRISRSEKISGDELMRLEKQLEHLKNQL